MNTPAKEETKSTSNVQQLLLDTLDDNRSKYRNKLKQSRDEFSEDAVHDLRVATRHLLALIELLRSVSAQPRLKKLRRAFKRQLDQMDGLRDTQVILAEVGKIIQELPQLQEFQRELQRREEKMLNRFPKEIKDFETPKLIKRIRKTRNSLETDTDPSLESKVLQAVDDAFHLVKQRMKWVDATRALTIHRVRVAFKALRYMIEIVYPLVADFPEENLKRMDEYQSLMGEVQDAEVFGQRLADVSESVSLPDVEAVRRYYDRRHRDAISVYLENMHQIDTFWRAAPDQPFPWEKPALS